MTTRDLVNTLKQGRPMTDKLMREIVRELEEKTEQLHTMGTALRAKDADYAALRSESDALKEALSDLLDRYVQAIGNEGIECYNARHALRISA